MSNSTTLQRESPLSTSVRLESIIYSERLLRGQGCQATITIGNQSFVLKLFLFPWE